MIVKLLFYNCYHNNNNKRNYACPLFLRKQYACRYCAVFTVRTSVIMICRFDIKAVKYTAATETV